MIKTLKILAFFALFLASPAHAQKIKKGYDALITLNTSFGDIKFLLYEDTPKHRENFLKLVKEKYYDGMLFHRIINGFMIQGGDPNSKKAQPHQILGSGDIGYKIDAEFLPHRFHKKGALAAARDGNPKKASSGCQFYLVQGKTYSEEDLKKTLARSGATYTPEQIESYKTKGGTPQLDQNYTVFGEAVEGLDVIDKIAQQPRDPNDRPNADIAMKMTMELVKKTDITAKYGYVYMPASKKKKEKKKAEKK